MVHMRVAAFASVLLVIAACGSPNASGQASHSSAPQVVASASPSPSGTNPSPQALTTPGPLALTCTSQLAPIAELALVTLRNSADIAVRDISNLSKPVTRCLIKTCVQSCITFGPSFLRFVNSTHISYLVQAADGSTSALYLVDLQTRKTSLVLGAQASQGMVDYAWSPDGNSLVYAAGTDKALVVHQLTAGRDRVLGSVAPIPAVGCEVACPQANIWDVRLLYSPDGSRISLVYGIVHSVFRVWSSDGTLLKAIDTQAQAQSMSVWAGSGLYFEDSKGVEVWRAGVTSTFLPGIGWIRPRDSSSGGSIVYASRDNSGVAHTYVVDATSSHVRELEAGRSEPVFLTFGSVWYQGERACVAADNCQSGQVVVSTGKTYIYDLQSGTETESVIASVADVWPHGA